MPNKTKNNMEDNDIKQLLSKAFKNVDNILNVWKKNHKGKCNNCGIISLNNIDMIVVTQEKHNNIDGNDINKESPSIAFRCQKCNTECKVVSNNNK